MSPPKRMKIRPANHKLLRRALDNTNATPSVRWKTYGIPKTAFIWMYEKNHPLSQACQMRLTENDLTATFSDHSYTDYHYQILQEHCLLHK